MPEQNTLPPVKKKLQRFYWADKRYWAIALLQRDYLAGEDIGADYRDYGV